MDRKLKSRLAGAAWGALVMLALPAGAQTAQAGPAADRATTARTSTAPAAQAEELTGTARLNAEQARKARVEQEDYTARVRNAEESVARNNAEFDAQTAAYEQSKADSAARAAAAQAQWQADVAACEAGDRTRCGVPVSIPN